jgi:DNA replication protein DnaC
MISLCQRLNLTSVMAVLPQLLDEARQQQLSYEALLERVLTVELEGRQQRAQARRLRAARLPLAARIESFDFRFQPSISERLIHELASLTFLQTATNVLLLGPPGVGKTHLACGLARCALDAGHSTLFVTLRELSQQLAAPLPRGGAAALRRYCQPTLLIIDEIGYTNLSREQAQALFELVATRYTVRSTVVTSNLTFAEWGALLGDEVLATALLDRLLHHAEIVSINGRSYRMRQRLGADQPSVSSATNAKDAAVG